MSSKKAAWCTQKQGTLKSASESGWSQNINKTEFPGVWMFRVIIITAFELIPYSYYIPYNAPALINAPNRFSENNVE